MVPMGLGSRLRDRYDRTMRRRKKAVPAMRRSLRAMFNMVCPAMLVMMSALASPLDGNRCW